LPTSTPAKLPGDEPNPYAMLPLCTKCLKRPAHTLLSLKYRIWDTETRVSEVESVCRRCSNLAWGEEIKCDSRDCPIFYTRIKERSRLSAMKDSVSPIIALMEKADDEAYSKRQESIERESLAW
jgi:DNA polymerase zeta